MPLRHVNEDGFSLVELMVVVLILGILVAVAIPAYQKAKSSANERACFANQRTIEGAVRTWEAVHGPNLAPLTGIVDKDNPLLKEYMLNPVPICPAAPRAADSGYPTLAEGAYQLDDEGYVDGCSFDGHGLYH